MTDDADWGEDWDFLLQVILMRAPECGWCGQRFDRTLERAHIHHRKLRSRRGDLYAIANLVALHPKCHNMGTGSVHLAVREATRRGFMVESTADPVTVPLTLAGGRVVWLSNDNPFYSDTPHQVTRGA